MIEYFLLFIIALLANGFSAFAGGGAGLLQLPILIFLGLPFNVALATHKIASVALGMGSSARYWREKILDLRFAGFIIAFGLPGVIFGANIILKIDDQLATLLLGLLTLSLGLYSFFKPSLGQIEHSKNRTFSGYLLGGMVICLIGIANGSLTSGTGLFLTLWLVRWFGFDYQRAVAHTLIMVGLFWNGAGAITLSLLGEVQWDWLIPLISGSLLGGYLGANLAIKKGNGSVKIAFELMTLAAGISLIYKAMV